MGFFSFIESFFFLSLGITFVLIFLMVFHFKQRVEQLEKKNENMLEVCNGLVQQIHGLKTFCISNISSFPSNPNPNSNIGSTSRLSENITFSTSTPIPIPDSTIPTNSFQKIVVEDFEGEEEEGEEEEEDFEGEEGEEEEGEEEEGEEEEGEEVEIDVSDELENGMELENENMNMDMDMDLPGMEEVDMNFLSEVEVEPEPAVEPEEVEPAVEPEVEEPAVEVELELEKEPAVEEPSSSRISNEENWKNLSLNQLKQLVSNKGLSSNPNKMKKQELIHLLQKSSNEKSLQDLAFLL